MTKARVQSKKKTRGKGNKKGGRFERKIAKVLSLWVSRSKKKDLFWRTAMSGGRATVARKRGELVRQSGDITAVTPEGHDLTDKFFIELKHYNDLNLLGSMLHFRGRLAKFWNKCVSEANYYGRIPILIALEDRKPTLIVTNRRIVGLTIITLEGSMFISKFDEVIKHISFNEFREMYGLGPVTKMHHSDGKRLRLSQGSLAAPD